ncbi:hypothetical protein NKDENANG_01861 [Candidatus Entotheonellaceae bacterium PAL068K]
MERLNNLFRQKYNRDEWLQTLRLLLSARIFSQPLPIADRAASEFYRLGSVTLADQKQLGIYEVKTKPQTYLHRNRVQMRQLAARQCYQNSEDGALAVYYNGENHWRFSFISMEYQTDDWGKVIKKESIPRRYTYLLGEGARCRTAVSRFSQLNKNATLHDLKTAFAVEQLNREFYQKLFKWYEKAKGLVTFPNDEGEEKDNHIPISLIRLLTRLLFLWFIKEKGLVNPDFFDLGKLRQLIRWDEDSSYYKAILQNLFFATLNQEINKRSFRTQSSNYLVTNIYRYQNLFLKPDEKHVLPLFQQTPFLNGGLFECLDRDATDAERQQYDQDKSRRRERSAIRIDGFSDRDNNPLRVSNQLFFSDDDQRPGLIDLLKQYQFTVEESTPLDADVALDPELLGLVFENLLAAYNPETRETARKQTGSYYTPREIVGYMVDESLKAYLTQAAVPPDGDADLYRNHLDDLFAVSSGASGQTEKTTAAFIRRSSPVLIAAIESVKILDPAVGSGAFPMGALHRLVALLGLIDPDNAIWKQRQIDTVKALDDPESREQALRDIEAIFSEENRYNDFGRKLYLIENAIYGVDVQPIAVQIAKLRFFISLTIEQNPTGNVADNYGIKPLPNLETRFVAANSLIGLNKPKQLVLSDAGIASRENELENLRRKYFTARTLKTKRKYKERDKQLRNEIAKLLVKNDWNDREAGKIAHWDPYDQNARADWFDAEYMFGVKDGFDVVLGNPPYAQLQKDGGKLGRLYQDAGYETFVRSGDIYQLFYEKGCQLLSQGRGVLAYITSNSWLKAQYGKKTRKYVAERHQPLRLLEMGKDVFEAIVDASVLILRHGKSEVSGKAVDLDDLPDTCFPPAERFWGRLRLQGEKPWLLLSAIEQGIMDKMEAIGTALKDWDVCINYGIKTGYNAAFMIDTATRERLVAEDSRSAEIIKPVLRGRDIQRFQARWAGVWLIDTHNGYANVAAVNLNDYPAVKTHLHKFYPQLVKRQNKGKTPYNLQSVTYHENFAKEKLFWIELVENGRFAYDDSGLYGEATTFIMTGSSLKYLCAVLNTKLVRWYLRQIAPTSGMGTLRWKKVYVETIPIPKIFATEQPPFIRLVDDILKAKAANPSADTSYQEAEIDRRVYALYKLTEKEIKAVESKQ